MIGRKSPKATASVDVKPQGFDDYQLRLGDVMRGERATMGKSLLDVQRELRIKASYIAAIENCDPSAFDTPGFIAGYVRSYARYLGLDPDEAFDHFCAESGFAVSHGMSKSASSVRKSPDVARPRARDPLAEPKLPFSVKQESLWSRIEPGAIGSTLVLVALIGGLGYGGWSVLQEVQRVQVAPVDQTPLVLSELDPLDAAGAPKAEAQESVMATAGAGVFSPPSSEAFDRLYRPQALDVPVLVARDAPISTLDPNNVGVFAGLDSAQNPPGFAPRVAPAQQVAATAPLNPDGVHVVAVRPAWVRVTDGSDRVLFSGILNGGDTFAVPQTAADPRIEVGESSAVFLAVNGTAHGPVGARGTVSTEIDLTEEAIVARFDAAPLEADGPLSEIMAAFTAAPAEELDPIAAAIAAATRAESDTAAPVIATGPQPGIMPKVLADSVPGVTIVASREAWVRVKAPSGATLYEAIMQAGDSYVVPQTEQPPTIRTGDAGAIYFAVNGQTFGPYGSSGSVQDGLALSPSTVTQQMAVADLTQNATLARIVAELAISRN